MDSYNLSAHLVTGKPHEFAACPRKHPVTRFKYRKYVACPRRPLGRLTPITAPANNKRDSFEHMPEGIPNYLTEAQLSAVQSHLRVTEAFLRMRHRTIAQTDAPYGESTAASAQSVSASTNANVAGFASILESSVDGLSGYLSSLTALSSDRLRLLSSYYLSLQQYVTTESSLQRGNPLFIPSPNLRSSQLPPICIYFPQSMNGAKIINYSGLLLGPQASTQRELQSLTGTELQLRGGRELLGGKSTVVITKRADGGVSLGDDDIPHIRISGASLLGRVLAMRIILEIITDPKIADNSLKQRQLIHHASLSGMDVSAPQLGVDVQTTLQDAPWIALYGSYKASNLSGQDVLEQLCSSRLGQRAMEYRGLCATEARYRCGLTSENALIEEKQAQIDSSDEPLLPPGA